MKRAWSEAVCFATAALALMGASGCTAPLEAEVDAQASDHTELPTMAASYGLSIHSTVVTHNEEEGTQATLETHLFSLVQATQTGAEVALTLQPCRVLLPPAGGHQGTVDDSTMQLAKPSSASAWLVSAEAGYQLHSDAFQVLLGVENVAPDEPLPTEGDDERVIDIDDDDAPGFSVHFSIMRVYSGLRAFQSLSGQPMGNGQFAGTVDLDVDHVIYGDSNWLVDAKGLAEEAASGTMVLSEDHSFVLSPLDAGEAASCTDVLAVQ
ncbi:MAG: hypothetical protein DRI90_13185 [Deltaproteobacteria bacterium]|nr:MAG: hypothetical protein DRI90_13185 [Deltaproteobacteria bacterium]